MKNIKLLLVSMLAAVFSGCMDHHDDPTNYTYGNPAVGGSQYDYRRLKDKICRYRQQQQSGRSTRGPGHLRSHSRR